MNFEYFKYPKTVKPIVFERHGVLYSIREIPDPPTKLEDTVNRGKAVVKYFKDLLLGTTKERLKSKHVLDPKFGEKWRKIFQAKHGKFGENLVMLLGDGPSKDELVKSGAIDN